MPLSNNLAVIYERLMIMTRWNFFIRSFLCLLPFMSLSYK